MSDDLAEMFTDGAFVTVVLIAVGIYSYKNPALLAGIVVGIIGFVVASLIFGWILNELPAAIRRWTE